MIRREPILRPAAIAVATLLMLAIVACAPSADLTQMQGDEASLREMVANDRQQIEALQEKLKRQNDRLAELEHNQDSQDSDTAADHEATPAVSPVAAASPAAGQTISGAAPETSAAAAPGAPAEPGAEATAAEPGAPAAAPSAGSEMAALTPPPAPAAAPPAAPPVTPPAEPVTPAPTWQAAVNQELGARQSDPAARLYRAGLVDLKAGKFQPALAKFQDLQRRYPKSSLSEAAEYFSGTALYQMGQHEKSILQFNDLTMRYPEGRFASAALLSEAQAFVSINDQIDARLTLQKLLNDHPSAPEAPTAKSMMDSLSS